MALKRVIERRSCFKLGHWRDKEWEREKKRGEKVDAKAKVYITHTQ